MALRCWAIFLILHLTGKVFLQGSASIIYSAVGDTVILPCQKQQEMTDVFWRHNISGKVFNIINGIPSPGNQERIFRNRTDSFPLEYAKGNYSIKLKDVEFTHAGNYSCFLSKSNEKKLLQLVVKEKPAESTPKPKTEKNIEAAQDPLNSSAEAQAQILIYQIALLGLTLHLFFF